MAFIKSTFLNASNLLPVKWLQKVSPIDLYLPYHHLVTNDDCPHISHLYSFKNESQFIKDLDYLLKYFTPLNVNDVVEYVRNDKPLSPNGFLMTFDDGFKEIRTVVAPILYQKGVPAIFFLNSSFLDNKDFFYRLKVSLLIDELLKNNKLKTIYARHLETSSEIKDIITELKKINFLNKNKTDAIAQESGFSFEEYVNKNQPFLTSAQVSDLLEMGFSIGGHSKNHPYLPILSTDAQVDQILGSTNFLAQKFNLKHRLFAFPHSDSEIKQEVINALLKDGIDVLFGIQNQKPELYNRLLHRFNAERPSVSLQKQIKAEIVHAWMLDKLGKLHVRRS